MKCSVALFCSILSCKAILAQQPDPVSLVKQSIANHQRDWQEGAQWRYKQVDITWNGDGKQVETSEIVPLYGTPYERVIARDGKPLSAEEQQKEEQKYEKTLEKRKKETPAERQARLKKRSSEWTFLRDIPNAYEFTILGEEALNGRPAWIVKMTPREDFTPTTSRGSMLKHIEGQLWIDKQEVQWAKAEAHVIGTIEIGWVLARIGPGADIEMKMTRVADNLWMPASIDIHGSAKVLLVHRKDLNEKLFFSDFARVGKDEPIQVSGNPLQRSKQ